MKDVLHEELVRENQKRLQTLLATPIPILAYDIHGFVLGKDPKINREIIELQTDLLQEGLVLAAVTGFGDRIHHYHTNPILNELQARGALNDTVPFYISTRNGALTQHAVTGEVIDEHPIDEEMYVKITTHPLIRAIHTLTPESQKQSILDEYQHTRSALGFELHPQCMEYPGIRHDWCPQTKRGYQLTALYDAEWIDISCPNPHLDTIREFCNGYIPLNSHDMAFYIKEALHKEGIEIAANTAGSHPEIDIARPGISKKVGCEALAPRIASFLDISLEEVLQRGVGGGDSPLYNDRPLITFFANGITNVDHWEEKGPIVLDFPEVLSPIERTMKFLSEMKVG